MTQAPRPHLTVWDGVAITLGALALLALLGIALAMPHFEAMFKELGHAELPPLTRFVLRGGSTWRVGVPVVLLIAFVAAFVRRTPLAVRVGLVMIIAIVALVWLFALYAPVFALAGNIHE